MRGRPQAEDPGTRHCNGRTIFMNRMLALAAAGALVLSGCGESGAPADVQKKTVLEYASMKDIRNINPHLYLGEMAAQAMVFEPLVFNTPEGVKPALAERWEISDDGRTYTFHLRRGVKFTDGTPFTADAVKKNIDAVLANRTRHAWLDMINEIESSEALDEHTWRLHLKHPYFPALIELGLSRPFRFISPACMKNGGTKDGVSCLAGTGPWGARRAQGSAVRSLQAQRGLLGREADRARRALERRARYADHADGA